jgi:hypothetical protein
MHHILTPQSGYLCTRRRNGASCRCFVASTTFEPTASLSRLVISVYRMARKASIKARRPLCHRIERPTPRGWVLAVMASTKGRFARTTDAQAKLQLRLALALSAQNEGHHSCPLCLDRGRCCCTCCACSHQGSWGRRSDRRVQYVCSYRWSLHFSRLLRRRRWPCLPGNRWRRGCEARLLQAGHLIHVCMSNDLEASSRASTDNPCSVLFQRSTFNVQPSGQDVLCSHEGGVVCDALFCMRIERYRVKTSHACTCQLRQSVLKATGNTSGWVSVGLLTTQHDSENIAVYGKDSKRPRRHCPLCGSKAHYQLQISNHALFLMHRA